MQVAHCSQNNGCWEDYEMQEKGRKRATVCRVSNYHEAVRACVAAGGQCALQVLVTRQLWCSGRHHAGISAVNEVSIAVELKGKKRKRTRAFLAVGGSSYAFL